MAHDEMVKLYYDLAIKISKCFKTNKKIKFEVIENIYYVIKFDLNEDDLEGFDTSEYVRLLYDFSLNNKKTKHAELVVNEFGNRNNRFNSFFRNLHEFVKNNMYQRVDNKYSEYNVNNSNYLITLFNKQFKNLFDAFIDFYELKNYGGRINSRLIIAIKEKVHDIIILNHWAISHELHINLSTLRTDMINYNYGKSFEQKMIYKDETIVKILNHRFLNLITGDEMDINDDEYEFSNILKILNKDKSNLIKSIEKHNIEKYNFIKKILYYFKFHLITFKANCNFNSFDTNYGGKYYFSTNFTETTSFHQHRRRPEKYDIYSFKTITVINFIKEYEYSDSRKFEIFKKHIENFFKIDYTEYDLEQGESYGSYERLNNEFISTYENETYNLVLNQMYNNYLISGELDDLNKIFTSGIDKYIEFKYLLIFIVLFTPLNEVCENINNQLSVLISFFEKHARLINLSVDKNLKFEDFLKVNFKYEISTSMLKDMINKKYPIELITRIVREYYINLNSNFNEIEDFYRFHGFVKQRIELYRQTQQ